MVTARSARAPQEELPCIWVMSGVLNYHLCDRDYECDGCELYHALSGEGRLCGQRPEAPAHGVSHLSDASSPSEQASWHLSCLLSGCRLYLDRPYRPPHFWLAEDDGDLVTVGLDGSLMRILSPIRRVVSPGPGLCLERDQPCGWIARDHMAVSLRMPIAGEVVEANAEYARSEAPCRLPDGDDWLFRVRPSESLEDVTGLVRGEGTLAWYAERLRAVKRAILSQLALPPAAPVGPVLADGGSPAPSLEGVLGREAFEELIAAIARN